MTNRLQDTRQKDALKAAGIIVVTLALASLGGNLFWRYGFSETTIVLLYVLAVLLTAVFTNGYGYGILTSVAATLAFNYFFTDPYHSFNVNDPGYIITFAVMTATSLIVSTLTASVKKHALEAGLKEKETAALYQLTSHLTEARDLHQVADIVTAAASDLLECKAAFLCFSEDGQPDSVYVQMTEDKRMVQRKFRQTETFACQVKNLREEGFEDEAFYNWPVYGEKQIIGILRIPVEDNMLFGQMQKQFIHSLTECTALAMERIFAVDRRMKSEQEVEQERYRGNLLRAISHDLRTPLSSIMGMAEMITNMSGEEDSRRELAQGINKDARWLHSLVENILSLTRMQEGRLILNKQPEAVEEIIGSAVSQMEKRAPGYEISVSVPEDLLMVPMDSRLMLQVLVNLLDNAVKHCAKKDGIHISVKKDTAKEEAVFKVADEGEGISAEDLPNIFQTFYTSRIKPVDAQKGIGLGLTICESIVRAHGGRITAVNRTDSPGAAFIFTLPLEERSEQAGE